MNKSRLLELKALGQHIWLDNLSRSLLREGGLQRLIDQDGVDGVTSNPAIFEKAIADSPYYLDDLENLLSAGLDGEACYEVLVVADIKAACMLLQPVYTSSGGETGYVSLEVSPELAQDKVATINAAHRLQRAVGCPNVLIKVPATPAGIGAFEQLTATGLRVNVTLIFSLAQYAAVAQAYLRGAQAWLDIGGTPEQLRSVASIFLSRVDTAVDQRLDDLGTAQAKGLRGQAGVALARNCYQHYREIFHGSSFASLRLAGMRPQTPLWASTGSKNPAYSDVLYVDALIGPETITTLPDATLAAYRDHGRPAARLLEGVQDAQVHIDALQGLGINPAELGQRLQADGLRLFAEAYRNMVTGLQTLSHD